MSWKTNKNLSVHFSWNLLCSCFYSENLQFACSSLLRRLHVDFHLLLRQTLHLLYSIHLVFVLLFFIRYRSIFCSVHVTLASWAIMTSKRALQLSEPVLPTMQVCCVVRFDSYPLLETTLIEVKWETQCGWLRNYSVVFVVYLCSIFFLNELAVLYCYKLTCNPPIKAWWAAPWVTVM